MKKTVCALLLSVPLVLSLAAQQPPAAPPTPPFTRQGSSKTSLRSQIDDLSNPPDWFPDEHPPAPVVVTKGQGAALACGACHLMSGHGHPESADLSGLPAEYIRRTMMDFK